MNKERRKAIWQIVNDLRARMSQQQRFRDVSGTAHPTVMKPLLLAAATIAALAAPAYAGANAVDLFFVADAGAPNPLHLFPSLSGDLSFDALIKQPLGAHIGVGTRDRRVVDGVIDSKTPQSFHIATGKVLDEPGWTIYRDEASEEAADNPAPPTYTMRTTVVAAAASPASVGTSLLPRLAEVDDAVKSAAPDFRCAEQGNKKSCQQIRGASDGKGGGFETNDFADGLHIRCFWPTKAYGLCQDNNGVIHAATTLNGVDVVLPSDDPRCKDWGSVDTIEYLACEAAQPQTLSDRKGT